MQWKEKKNLNMIKKKKLNNKPKILKIESFYMQKA